MNQVKQGLENTAKANQILLALVLGLSILIIPRAILHIEPSLKIVLLLTIMGISSFFIWRKKEKSSFSYSIYDALFLSFVAWNFLSVFWATNSSLVWSQGFIWLFVFLIYRYFKNFDLKEQSLFLYEVIFLILLLINIVFVSALFYELSQMPSNANFREFKFGHKYLGNNANYIATLLVLFLPFVLVATPKLLKGKYWSFLIFFSQVVFVIFLQSRGAILGMLLMVCLYFFWKPNPIKRAYFLKAIGLGLTIALAIIFIKFDDPGEMLRRLNPLNEIMRGGSDDRLRLWNKSFQLFKEKPIHGQGAGNWVVEHPKIGVGDLQWVADKDFFFKHPHNLYVQVIAELGLVGLLLLLAILLLPLFLTFRNRKKIIDESNSDVIVLMSLVIVGFLMMNNFFGVTYVHSPKYIAHTVLMVLGISILMNISETKNGQHFLIKPRRINALFNHSIWMLLLLSSMAFFACRYYWTKQYKAAIQLKRAGKYSKAIKKIEPIYHEKFNNTSGVDFSIAAEIGSLYALKGNTRKAIANYEKALKQYPYNFPYWYALGQLYWKQKDRGKAEACFLKVYEINNEYYRVIVDLTQLNVAKKNWEKALFWSGKFERIRTLLKEYKENPKRWEVSKKAMVKLKMFRKYNQTMNKLLKRIPKEEKK